MKERQVCDEAVVEVDFGREPCVVIQRSEDVAIVLRRDNVEADRFAELVNAAAESSSEQIDAHDAEDEPEYEADEQYVENGGNRLDQRVHDHLRKITHVQLKFVEHV